MTARCWWTGLNCALCGRPARVKDGDAIFRRNFPHEPTAEHYDCRRFLNAVDSRLAKKDER